MNNAENRQRRANNRRPALRGNSSRGNETLEQASRRRNNDRVRRQAARVNESPNGANVRRNADRVQLQATRF